MWLTDILVKCKPLLIDLHLYILFQMVRMSTGHMEGDLQPLYLLLTDCYIYLLRKGQQTFSGRAGHCLYVCKSACLHYLLCPIDFQGQQRSLIVLRRRYLIMSWTTSLWVNNLNPKWSVWHAAEIRALVCALGWISPADYHSGVH